MRKILLTIFSIIICLSQAAGQVLIDRQVEMTGTTNADRIVTGIAYPSDSTSAVNAEDYSHNRIVYASGSGNSQLYNLQVNPQPSAYKTGMSIYFIAPVTSSDSLKVSLNGLPVKDLFKDYLIPLDSGDIQQGQAVKITYDGSNFRIVSLLQPNCPEGFLPVNEKYCIELDEAGPAGNFFGAASDCFSRGARLCTWTEWYYACQNTSLGLNNMTNNYEWVDDAANEDGFFRVTGSGLCTTIAAQSGAGSQYPHRCCYSR